VSRYPQYDTEFVHLTSLTIKDSDTADVVHHRVFSKRSWSNAWPVNAMPHAGGPQNRAQVTSHGVTDKLLFFSYQMLTRLQRVVSFLNWFNKTRKAEPWQL
jgi:hypothetical protein